MRQWPEKLRRLMRSQVTQTAIGIVLALVVPTEVNAVTNTLVTWIWPKSGDISLGFFLLLASTIYLFFSTIILMVVDIFCGSSKKDDVDKDS